jgi:hypothetical protein
VLDALFPAQHATFQTQYDASLAGLPNGAAKESGVEVGTMAADAMLAQGHDGRHVMPCVFGAGPGAWIPLPGLAPGTFMCDPTPWVANGVPFIVESSSQFRTAGPYALTSPEYAADLNEVERIGSLTSTPLDRNAQQTHIAVFWQSNPAGNYNALARRFVDEQGLDVSQSARMFAMIDLTAADAIINAWNDKYYWSFWRPMAAIRGADTDGNPDTVAAPSWKPLFDPSLDPSIAGAGPPLVTPPYPDQPSGATSYASATMHAFQSFFGTDDMAFYLTSSRFPTEQLHFTHFSAVIDQVIEARIWAGIHFRHADVDAANLGRQVEEYTHTHQFAFVH